MSVSRKMVVMVKRINHEDPIGERNPELASCGVRAIWN